LMKGPPLKNKECVSFYTSTVIKSQEMLSAVQANVSRSGCIGKSPLQYVNHYVLYNAAANINTFLRDFVVIAPSLRY